jgi:hypothetical protein
MASNQPIKPDMLCYVQSTNPKNEITNRIVVTVRIAHEQFITLPDGKTVRKVGSETSWWVRAPREGETLPFFKQQMRERPILQSSLRPILPPEDSDITTTTKEKELTHGK